MSQQRIDEWYDALDPEEKKSFLAKVQKDMTPAEDMEDWQKAIVAKAKEEAKKEIANELSPYMLPLVKDAARSKFLDGLNDAERAVMEESLKELNDQALHAGAQSKEVLTAFRNSAKFEAAQKTAEANGGAPDTKPDAKPDEKHDRHDEARDFAKNRLGIELSPEAVEKALSEVK